MFVKQICNMSDRKLDRLVAVTADELFAATDCTACARCCTTLRPVFSEKFQELVAKRLGITTEQFRERYLELCKDEDGTQWQIRQAPCPFLIDNKCSIYEDRPDNCRDYPYLYKNEFRTRLWAMVERTVTCPIVFNLLEELKAKLRFR
jgi:uncharacterized protein